MITISEEDFAELEDNIDQMLYKPGDNFDPWYPTMTDIREKISGFNKSDIMFLLWLTKPGMKLDAAQTRTRKHIMKLLYDPRILKIAFENAEEGEEP